MLAVALTSAAVAALFTQQQPTRYESTVTLVVQTSAGANDTETLIRTMMALVDSEIVGEELRERTTSPLPVDTITDNIGVERPPGSSVMTITYTDTDPDRSVATAQEILPVFQEQVELLGAEQAGRLAPNYAIQPWGGGAVITADVPAPVLRNAAIAALLGALVGTVGAVLYRQWNPQIRTAGDAEEATGLPVVTASLALASIRPGRSHWNPNDVMDAVLNRLPEALGERVLPRRILVVSTESGRTRAAFITHLARSLQRREGPVTVVDADLEHGALSRELGLKQNKGLADVLRGREPASGAVTIPATGMAAGLSVLPAGTDLPFRTGSSAAEVTGLDGDVRIIVNSPGLSAHQPLGSLVREVDAVLVLLAAGSADMSETASLSALVRALGTTPAAVVLLAPSASRPRPAEPLQLPRLAPRTTTARTLSS